MGEATNTILGYATWHGPVPLEERKKKKDDGDDGPRGKDMPAFVNIPVFEHMMAACTQAKKDVGFAERRDFWYLSSLAVHPDNKGKGVASKLMEFSLRELVDRDGMDAYLESTPAGWKVYERCGFEERMVLPRMEGEYVMRIGVRPAMGKGKGNGGVAVDGEE